MTAAVKLITRMSDRRLNFFAVSMAHPSFILTHNRRKNGNTAEIYVVSVTGRNRDILSAGR